MAEKKSQNIEVNTTFGEKLFDLRKDRGLNQQELADLLGISLKTIQNYEKNELKDLSFINVKKISSFFNVSIDYLAGYKTNKTIEDTSLDSINLTREAINAVSNGKYDHSLLSEIISHPQFNILMLDIMVLTSQQYALNMVQNNAVLSYSRKLLLEKTDGIENFDSKLIDLSTIDEDIFVKEAIHKDLDIILQDLIIAHPQTEIEQMKELMRLQIIGQMDQALEDSKKAKNGSPDQLIDIVLGSLKLSRDKMTAEQLDTLLEIIKLSPLLKSGVSQRGKKNKSTGE